MAAKNDRSIIYNEITIHDNALVKPWTLTRKARRDPKPRPVWLSDVCAEGNAVVKIGNVPYFLSADGRLMPTRKDQPPPDTSFFTHTRK